MVIYLGNICPGIFIEYVSLFFYQKSENKFKIICLQWLFSLIWRRTFAIDLSPVLFPTVKDFLLFSCSVVFVQIDCLRVWFFLKRISDSMSSFCCWSSDWRPGLYVTYTHISEFSEVYSVSAASPKCPAINNICCWQQLPEILACVFTVLLRASIFVIASPIRHFLGLPCSPLPSEFHSWHNLLSFIVVFSKSTHLRCLDRQHLFPGSFDWIYRYVWISL